MTTKQKTNDSTFEVVELDLDDILVTEEDRGRRRPVGPTKVKELAESIIAHGQLQPVEVQPADEDGKYRLTYGFTRRDAVALINAKLDPKHKRKLWCRVLASDEEQRIIRNILENNKRENPSPVDNAANMLKLKERFGYSNARIGGLFGVTKVWVGKLLKLLTLSPPILRLIEEGSMTASAALSLLEVEEKHWAKIVEAASLDDYGNADKETDEATGKGKLHVSSRVLRKEINRIQTAALKRSQKEDQEVVHVSDADAFSDQMQGIIHHQDRDDDEDMAETVVAPKGKKKTGKKTPKITPLDLVEIRAFWQSIVDLQKPVTPLAELATEALGFMRGETTADEFEGYLLAIVGER